MAENNHQGLPVVDLGRLLSPEAFSKLRATRQRREQAERAQVPPFNDESSQNESEKADSGDNSLKDTHQSEKEASADAEEHDVNNMDATMSSSDDSLKETCPCEIESKKTGSGDNSLKETHQSEKESIVAEERDGGGNNMDATMSETATASFEVGPDNMQMSEDTTHGDSEHVAVATKFTSLSLGPIKKRKRPETTTEGPPQSFDLTLGARDGIRNGFDFAVARLVEHTASNNTVPCSLLSAYRSIPLSVYRRSTCSRYEEYYDPVSSMSSLKCSYCHVNTIASFIARRLQTRLCLLRLLERLQTIPTIVNKLPGRAPKCAFCVASVVPTRRESPVYLFQSFVLPASVFVRLVKFKCG